LLIVAPVQFHSMDGSGGIFDLKEGPKEDPIQGL
jgi:hypothetical protein